MPPPSGKKDTGRIFLEDVGSYLAKYAESHIKSTMLFTLHTLKSGGSHMLQISKRKLRTLHTRKVKWSKFHSRHTRISHHCTKFCHLVPRICVTLVKICMSLQLSFNILSTSCYNQPFLPWFDTVLLGVCRGSVFQRTGVQCWAAWSWSWRHQKPFKHWKLTRSMAWHHSPEKLDLQQHCCEYLRSPHRGYNFTKHNHYCNTNGSSAGRKIPYFSWQPQVHDYVQRGSLASARRSSPHHTRNYTHQFSSQFYCMPQTQNLMKILLLIL